MKKIMNSKKIHVTDEEYEEAARLPSVKSYNLKDITRKSSIVLLFFFCFIVSCFTYIGIEDYLSDIFAAPLALLVFFALVNLTTKGFKELWE